LKVPFLDLKAQYNQIKPDIDSAIQNVVEDCSFVQGPYLKDFEKSFAEYLGIKNVIGTNSGTSALAIILLALKTINGWQDKNWEALIPANTFIATAESVLQAGGKPVFVDIDKKTYNIDVTKIEKSISNNTKVIVPVHLYGQPADMDNINQIAEKYNLLVVEDAAQAHGAEYRITDSNWKRAGGFGVASSFSFYASKNLGAYGDGGAVATNNDEISEFIRMYRDHGSKEKYDHKFTGSTDRLDDIQAAVLKVKLNHLDKWNSERSKNANIYSDYLSEVEGVKVPLLPKWAKSTWHLFVVRVSDRVGLMKHLKNNDIGCGFHYKTPLHLQPALNFLGYKKDDFPVTEKIMNEIISLPMYPELTEKQIQYVVQKIKDFVS